MRDTRHDKTDAKEALDDIRGRRVELERKVAEARVSVREAEQTLQVASSELKECYTEIATLKSVLAVDDEGNQAQITAVESQHSGEVPALYDAGFTTCYW